MSTKNPIINALNRFSDVLLALGVVTIVIMMIIPLPAFLLDLLLALNITLALVIVMISIYNVEPLQFFGLPFVTACYDAIPPCAERILDPADSFAGLCRRSDSGIRHLCRRGATPWSVLSYSSSSFLSSSLLSPAGPNAWLRWRPGSHSMPCPENRWRLMQT